MTQNKKITHNGYFSMDKKKHFIDLKVKALQSCSAKGICWDNAAMESANGI